MENISSRLAIIKKGQIIFNGAIKDLLEQSKGFVWSGTVTMDQYMDLSQKCKITSNIVEKEHHYLRILSKDKPGKNFTEIIPNLEEAYLKMVGEEVI